MNNGVLTGAETERPCVLCCHSHRPSMWSRQTVGCFHLEKLLTTAVGGTRRGGAHPLRAQGHPIRELLDGYSTFCFWVCIADAGSDNSVWSICDFLQHLIHFLKYVATCFSQLSLNTPEISSGTLPCCGRCQSHS